MHEKVDKNDLKSLFYRDETTFSFEKYVTKTKTKFYVLENYNVPLYEEDNIKEILGEHQWSKQRFEN